MWIRWNMCRMFRKKLTDQGYQANSNAEWMNQAEQQSRMIQAVLGGIGAVSLFVAAIGIPNTMMMSIYERTKEIGVIKVLGCDMGDIRSMFLIESGFIGFMGGVVGLAFSYAVSAMLNHVPALADLIGNGTGGNISPDSALACRISGGICDPRWNVGWIFPGDESDEAESACGNPE